MMLFEMHSMSTFSHSAVSMLGRDAG